MGRFIDLLTESKVKKEQFVRDCSFFVKANADFISQYRFLRRGTPKNHGNGITKISARERIRIYGTSLSFYLYEKMRNNLPSRITSFPTQAFTPSPHINSDRKIYYVFPIGRNYKLSYNPDYEDFIDSNHMIISFFFSTPFVVSNDSTDIDFKSDFNVIRSIILRSSSNTPKDIIARYDYMYEFIDMYRDELNRYNPKLLEAIRNAEQSMKRYVSGIKVTKLLRGDMYGCEVSVTSPDGVYYVSKDAIDTVLEWFELW